MLEESHTSRSELCVDTNRACCGRRPAGSVSASQHSFLQRGSMGPTRSIDTSNRLYGVSKVSTRAIETSNHLHRESRGSTFFKVYSKISYCSFLWFPFYVNKINQSINLLCLLTHPTIPVRSNGSIRPIDTSNHPCEI